MTLLFDAVMRRSALLGAVLALVVGFATYSYVRSTPTVTAVAPAIERTTVLVARHELPPHSILTADDVELRELPAEAVLDSALRSADVVIGLYTTQQVIAGQQLLSSQFTAAVAASALAQLVPEGARAVSIAISDASAAGGLIAPGDRVDVIAVFEETRAGRNGSALVVDDVAVLAVAAAVAGAEPAAIDPRVRSSGGAPTQLSATVTLAVTPAQAQRLAVADEFGTLRLVVRRPGDAAPTAITAIDLALITGGTR